VDKNWSARISFSLLYMRKSSLARPWGPRLRRDRWGLENASWDRLETETSRPRLHPCLFSYWKTCIWAFSQEIYLFWRPVRTARSAGNLHNRSSIYRSSHVVIIGLSFALPSGIPVFTSQHVDSILFHTRKTNICGRWGRCGVSWHRLGLTNNVNVSFSHSQPTAALFNHTKILTCFIEL